MHRAFEPRKRKRPVITFARLSWLLAFETCDGPNPEWFAANPRDDYDHAFNRDCRISARQLRDRWTSVVWC